MKEKLNSPKENSISARIKRFLENLNSKFFSGPDDKLDPAPQVPTSSHLKDRERLKIPPQLNDKPVLYLSAHRNNAGLEAGKEEVFLDLTTTPADDILSRLRYFIGKVVEEIPTLNSQDPHAHDFYIVGVTYLPALKEDGKTELQNDPSVVFGLDRNNYAFFLPRIKEFLESKGFLKQTDQLSTEIQAAVNRTLT